MFSVFQFSNFVSFYNYKEIVIYAFNANLGLVMIWALLDIQTYFYELIIFGLCSFKKMSLLYFPSF